MSDIGSQLRAAREAQGLSLEQVYKATRIKAVYIEAIEANRIDELPGLVQARGFVRSYANYLGLDGETLATSLGLSGAPAPALPQASASKPISVTPAKPPVQARPPEPVRISSLSLNQGSRSSASAGGGIPTPVLIAGAVILFLIGMFLIISALASGGAKPAPTPEANLKFPMGASLAAAIQPTQSPQPASEPVSLTLTSVEHVWARVTTDGQIAFEGLMEPGTAQNWQANQEIIVETGNAAALTVTYKGQSSTLGRRGQVVARAWSATKIEDVSLTVMGTPTGIGEQGSTISTSNRQP